MASDPHPADDDDEDPLLIGFGDVFALFSPRTGELVRVGQPGPHELVRDGAGELCVQQSQEDGISTPVKDLLKARLQTQDDVDIITYADGRRPLSLEQARREWTTMAFDIAIPDHGHGLSRFQCEAYHFVVSDAGWTIFWVYGYLSDALGITERKLFRYSTLAGPWKAHVAEFLPFVDESGGEAELHFRSSLRAAQMRYKGNADGVPMTTFETHEADHSMSSYALLVVLCMYSARPVHGRRAIHVSPGAVLARSRAVLNQLLRKFILGNAEFCYQHEEKEMLLRIVRDGSAVLLEWSALTEQHRELKKERATQTHGRVDMCDLMVTLCADVYKGYFSPRRTYLSRFLLAALCDVASAAIELSKASDLWLEFDVSRLRLRPAGKRKRRMSPAFKVAATQAAACAKRIRTVGQFMSAKAVLDDGDASGSGTGALDFGNTPVAPKV